MNESNNILINDVQYNLLMQQKNVVYSNKHWGNGLSEKEFIKGMSILNPQSYGSKIEKRIQNELGFNKCKPKDNCGDIQSKCGKNVEVKISILTPQNNSLNMVQIRLFHKVDYYLCVAYDCRDITNYKRYIFLLTHDEMQTECVNAGAAHGTTSINESNKNIELRKSIQCDTENIEFKRWKRKYHVESFEEVKKCIQKKLN